MDREDVIHAVAQCYKDTADRVANTQWIHIHFYNIIISYHILITFV